MRTILIAFGFLAASSIYAEDSENISGFFSGNHLHAACTSNRSGARILSPASMTATILSLRTVSCRRNSAYRWELQPPR